MEKTEIKRLFTQYYSNMLRVARTIIYDEQESEDVVSDIFEHLLHGQMVLMPETEERYLLTSVRNQCIKRMRHVSSPLGEHDNTELTDDAEAEDGRFAVIDEFVASHLSAQEQRIFHLRFTEGWKYEKIAIAEGISKVAVWKHLSHALNEVRNHFNR